MPHTLRPPIFEPPTPSRRSRHKERKELLTILFMPCLTRKTFQYSKQPKPKYWMDIYNMVNYVFADAFDIHTVLPPVVRQDESLFLRRLSCEIPLHFTGIHPPEEKISFLRALSVLAVHYSDIRLQSLPSFAPCAPPHNLLIPARQGLVLC